PPNAAGQVVDGPGGGTAVPAGALAFANTERVGRYTVRRADGGTELAEFRVSLLGPNAADVRPHALPPLPAAAGEPPPAPAAPGRRLRRAGAPGRARDLDGRVVVVEQEELTGPGGCPARQGARPSGAPCTIRGQRAGASLALRRQGPQHAALGLPFVYLALG